MEACYQFLGPEYNIGLEIWSLIYMRGSEIKQMLQWAWTLASHVKKSWDRARLENRWRNLRALGMHIGEGVFLPASTWIDIPHCYLISIGDWCAFGDGCLILAHDAQMDEFLDAGKMARVTIHESSHIGRCRSSFQAWRSGRAQS